MLYKFMKSIYSNFSVKAVAKNVNYRLASTISLTLLCLSSPLVNIATAQTQIADNTNQQAAQSISNAVSTLIQVLRSENIEARVNAARALGGMGTIAKIAEPALTVALYDKEARVRYTAATAIANLGGDTSSALPLLHEALQNESKWIRSDAAFALSSVALNMQTKARQLSEKELDRAITDLEKTVKVMEDSEFEISSQVVKSINDSVDSLKRERQREAIGF